MINWYDLADPSPSLTSAAEHFGFPSDLWEACVSLRNQKSVSRNNANLFSTGTYPYLQQELALIPLLMNGFEIKTFWERGDYFRIKQRLRIATGPEFTANQYRVVIGIVSTDITAAFETFKNEFTDAREYSIGLMETPRHKIRVAINKETQLVFVLSSRSTELGNLIRRVYSLLPVMFNIDLTQLQFPVPDTLFKLLWKPYEEWLATALVWIKQTKWLDQRRMFQIKENLLQFQQKRIDIVKRRARQHEHDLEETLEKYGQLCANLTIVRNQLQGMQQSNEDIEEQLRFISNVPNLHTFSIDTNQLQIALSTPAVNYDLALFRRILTNPSSFFNTSIKEFFPTDKRATARQLFELIFAAQKYVLYFNYSCSINSTQIRLGSAPLSELLGFNNPHLASFSCWGSAGPHIIKAYTEGDLVGCLQYVINAIANMNFADSVVVRRFVYLISQKFDSPEKFIQDPITKEFYTIQEVLTREADTVGQSNTGQAD